MNSCWALASLSANHLPSILPKLFLKVVMFIIFIAILIASCSPAPLLFTLIQNLLTTAAQLARSLRSNHGSFIYLHHHSWAPQELMKMFFLLKWDKGSADIQCILACMRAAHMAAVIMWSLMTVSLKANFFFSEKIKSPRPYCHYNKHTLTVVGGPEPLSTLACFNLRPFEYKNIGLCQIQLFVKKIPLLFISSISCHHANDSSGVSK